ncbi:MAG TPA: 2-phospho-L-lactate guanylyltransferase [Candidatus Acidoferrum sp.]|nr:2-phospho-L-lactate guanylyltransferase [Candidatus Acidoferrum sp.]
MRALLLPIKDLRQAKQRLAPLLSPEDRFGLAQAMLADTIRAVRSVQRADKIFVVTNYVPAMQAAEENGWEILREERQISESVSVDAASRQCAERGVTALLRLPLDVPLVRASDIDELLAVECAMPALVIVPSRDGTGTNAILRTPPALFPSDFGNGSFAKHCGNAQRAGAQIFVRRNSRLEMDVDDEADLRALARQDLRGTETGAWLQRSGLMERLMEPLISDKVLKLAANI